MTPWTVLATCGPAATVGLWWIHRISHHPTSAHVRIYVPPPLTEQYVDTQIAVLELQWERQR
ncbi:hypothetical protein [Kitasatospora sp. NPDC091276]|uniref:hypothetical protein n=1 Tax=unclassified Kitasatospora TaxID=2633591 RepID=UPI0034461159